MVCAWWMPGGGGGGTPIYVLGRYVLPPKRVWFFTGFRSLNRISEGTEKLSEPSIVKFMENQSEHLSKFVFKKISVPSVSTGAQIT